MGLNFLEALEKRWKGRKERKYLDTHGCKTWEEYHRKFDPDVGPMARWVHTFYHGYPYLYDLDKLFVSTWRSNPNAVYFPKIEEMKIWCKENCRGKWRNDWHRGFYDNQGYFEYNGIGGGDHMFFAFKDEADYMWFTLVFG